MEKKYRIVHYINQFFGQIGGEETAFAKPELREGLVGPGLAFEGALGEDYKIVGTIICGDNYMMQNTEEATEEIYQLIKPLEPDGFIAGPAFNAGRYGPACGSVCKKIQDELKIPVVTGMYAENPGVEIYRKDCFIVSTKDSAGGMRAAVKSMSALLKKLMEKEELPLAEIDNYFPRGPEKNIFVEQNGASRAVDMLLKKIEGKPFKSELVLPAFEKVKPASAVKNIRSAKIGLVTDAGITDKTNSYGLESARASKYIELEIKNKKSLSAQEFCSVHGGFDTSYANTKPDVLMPLDIVRELEREGAIGSLHDILYSTTGNATSLKNAQTYGQGISEKLLTAGVEGVILTST